MNRQTPLSSVSDEQLVKSYFSAEGGKAAFFAARNVVRNNAEKAPFLVRLVAGRFLERLAVSLDRAGENLGREVVDPTEAELHVRSTRMNKEEGINVH